MSRPQALSAELCQWHAIQKGALPFPCQREQRRGRCVCALHAAELDLRVFQLSHAPDALWVVHWAAGSRLMRRCESEEMARLLFERFPGAELELSPDRSAMEVRADGRLVALVRRLEATT